MTLQEIFAGCTAKPLLAEEPMAKHTSFRIGGPADLMAMPQSEQELQQLLQRAGEAKVPVTLIAGSRHIRAGPWLPKACPPAKTPGAWPAARKKQRP